VHKSGIGEHEKFKLSCAIKSSHLPPKVRHCLEWGIGAATGGAVATAPTFVGAPFAALGGFVGGCGGSLLYDIFH
jgi:hypothetical protein